MSFDFNNLVDRFNNSLEKGVQGVNKKVEEQVRKDSDAVVMAKLQKAEGTPYYDTVEKEARKRGLI